MSVSDEPRFPFGDPSRARPPRRPTSRCDAFVLGVYPSAIHVRWDLPEWGRNKYASAVGALAVSDEPTVFWDGTESEDLVDAWKKRVGFREGDNAGDWGHVRGVGNGTSGRPVRDKVLGPLGVGVDDTFFTDAVNTFYVKRGGPKSRQQGDVIDRIYTPLAAELELPAATLPTRPPPSVLVRTAVAEHSDRLRVELVEAAPPVVITLGEEARAVLGRIADEHIGPPATPLDGRTVTDTAYGEPGRLRIGQTEALWYAVAHPGNRDRRWAQRHEAWIERRRTQR